MEPINKLNNNIYFKRKYIRIFEIDIIKGIAIIMMVWGHCGMPGTHFFYLFHMAVFFIASGFCFKSADTLQMVWKLILKKFKSLYIPYVVTNGIFIILNNYLIKISWYTNDERILLISETQKLHTLYSYSELIKQLLKIFVFRGGSELGGATWFLPALFEVYVIYLISDFVIKKYFRTSVVKQHTIKWCEAVVLLIIGYILINNGIKLWRYELISITYILLLFGEEFNKAMKYISKMNDNLIWCCFMVSMFLLIILNQIGSINISARNITNPIFYILVSIFGWFFLWNFAEIIGEIKLLLFIGKNTLSILLLHEVIFRIINMAIVYIYDMPTYKIASHPTLLGNSIWGILYVIMGVCIPILFFRFILASMLKLVKSVKL